MWDFEGYVKGCRFYFEGVGNLKWDLGRGN